MLCFLLKIQNLPAKEVTQSCPSLQTPRQTQLNLVYLFQCLGKDHFQLQHFPKQANILSVISYMLPNYDQHHVSYLQPYTATHIHPRTRAQD